MEKKRIGVWLIAFPEGGGIYQYNLLILKALQLLKKDIFEVYCFSPLKEWKEFFRTYENKNLCDNFHLVSNNTVQDFIRQLFMIRHIWKTKIPFLNFRIKIWRLINTLPGFSYRFIKKLKIDLLICPSEDWQASEIPVKSITAIHDLMHLHTNCYSKINYIERELRYKSLIKFSNIILTDSEIGKQHIEKAYKNKVKAQLIPLPYIPANCFIEHERNKDYSYIHIKYNIPDKFIFYPAQFWKYKNHDGLIRALKLLKDKNIFVNAVFVGSIREEDKDYYFNLIRLIKEYNLDKYIFILGFVSEEDLISLYKNAHFLIMPTFSGPTNMPTIEAIICGCPVICSNLYAMPEQIGDAGLLVDPHNPVDIAEKIETLWTDTKLHEKLITECLSKSTSYNYNQFSQKLNDIIFKIL